MTTVQAQRLIEAMKGLGFRHGSYRTDGQFRVRTDGNGTDGFGDASVLMRTDVQAALMLRLDELVATGVFVMLIRLESGAMLLSVSSKYVEPYRAGRVWTVDYMDSTDGSPKFADVDLNEKEG